MSAGVFLTECPKELTPPRYKRVGNYYVFMQNTRNEEKAFFLYEKTSKHPVKTVRIVWRDVVSKGLLKQPKEEPH